MANEALRLQVYNAICGCRWCAQVTGVQCTLWLPLVCSEYRRSRWLPVTVIWFETLSGPCHQPFSHERDNAHYPVLCRYRSADYISLRESYILYHYTVEFPLVSSLFACLPLFICSFDFTFIFFLSCTNPNFWKAEASSFAGFWIPHFAMSYPYLTGSVSCS